MGNGIKNGGGSAAVVNGVLSEYYAHTEDISANTFVEFVNSYNSLYIAQSNSTKGSMTAVSMTDTKILVLYYASNQVHGVIVTISGAQMTLGTSYALWSPAEDPYLRAVKLTETSVFVVFGLNTYGGVVSVNGTTLSAGSSVRLNGVDSYSGYGRCIAKVSDTKVVAFYPVGASGYYVYGAVATISGTTVTWGTNTLLWEAGGVSGSVARECLALPNGKILVAFEGANQSAGTLSLYAMIATVNGTSISVGSSNMLHNVNSTAGVIRLAMLEDGRVAIAHGSGDLYVSIILINSNNTVSLVTRKLVEPYSTSDLQKLRAFTPIGGNQFLMLYKISASSSNGALRLITVSGQTVTASEERELAIDVVPKYFPMMSTTDDGFILMIYGSGLMYLSRESPGTLLGMSVKKSVSKIDGLTVGKLRPNAKGKVWTLG